MCIRQNTHPAGVNEGGCENFSRALTLHEDAFLTGQFYLFQSLARALEKVELTRHLATIRSRTLRLRLF